MMNDLLAELGIPALGPSAPKPSAQAPARLTTPKPSTPFTPPNYQPAVTFCIESFTVKEIAVDIANPRHAGAYLTTDTGTSLNSSYVASPAAGEAIEAAMEELIRLREATRLAEQKIIGRIFVLARESRSSVLNPAQAPVALTPNMFLEYAPEDEA
ncbi:MAG TPA: hypothetical protein VF077_00525 [Nitrospiraceae bacterium]